MSYASCTSTVTAALIDEPARMEPGCAMNPSLLAAAGLTVKLLLVPFSAASLAASVKLPALLIDSAVKVATPALAAALDGVMLAEGVVASEIVSFDGTRLSYASCTSTVTAALIDEPARMEPGCAVNTSFLAA